MKVSPTPSTVPQGLGPNYHRRPPDTVPLEGVGLVFLHFRFCLDPGGLRYTAVHPDRQKGAHRPSVYLGKEGDGVRGRARSVGREGTDNVLLWY